MSEVHSEAGQGSTFQGGLPMHTRDAEIKNN